MTVRKQFFNMIEIALALVVVGIGIMSLTSLIPIGSQAANRAIGTAYAANAGEDILHMLEQLAADNWSGTINSVPDVATGDDLPDVSNRFLGKPADDGWTEMSSSLGAGYWFKNIGGENAYRLTQETDGITDFDGIIRMWKSPTEASEWDPIGGQFNPSTADASYDKRALLNVEITWPAALEYDDRNRAHFAMEVIRRD